MTLPPDTPCVPSTFRRAVAAAAMFVLFLVVDQITKAVVRSSLITGVVIPGIPGIFEFRFAANTGAAFSLGEGYGFVFIALAVAVVVFTVVYLVRAPRVSWLEVIGLGMLAGGAAGNAIDRLLLGFVTDFIATIFIDFPVFNVADIGITCGAVIAFIGFAFSPVHAVPEDADGKGSAGEGEDGR